MKARTLISPRQPITDIELYDSSQMISNPHNIFSNPTRRLRSEFEKDRVDPGDRQSFAIFSDV